MSRLFISHSSWNNDKPVGVRDWLAKNGWDDVFLDLDPERGIAAGQRWKEALKKAAWRCEVVLALVSKEWLASSWCKAEVDAARLAAGEFTRRVSPRDTIPTEARPLIDRFADQRLLIRDRRKDAKGKDVDVLEVAHEALLRQSPFSDWLAEDREFLVWRDRLGQARTAFESEQRDLLAGRELAIAQGYLQSRVEREFEPADLNFIRERVAADDKRTPRAARMVCRDGEVALQHPRMETVAQRCPRR